MTTQFQVGKTYYDRSSCDWDTIYSFTILARTAKTVTIKSKHGEITKRGVRLRNDVEQFKPFGSYSMCAIVSADRPIERLAA
jgi:hypothetical protein